MTFVVKSRKCNLFLAYSGGSHGSKIKAGFKDRPNIRKYRMQSHLTQDQVTAKMQLMGINISRSIYSQIESGTYNIRISELAAMKEYLTSIMNLF